ncbi:MAG: GerMN domain-containing protein [Clostridia bacterium]|jgi:hypothetical protein|nr:GerMN domain-containing protein [Clostridia bacterium]
MFSGRKIKLALTVVILAAALLAAGACGPKKPGETGLEPTAKSETAYLYFSDDQALFLVPEKREITYNGDLAVALVEELIEGPTQEGLWRTLPERSRVLSIKVEESIAYVDFSKEFETDYPGGSTAEGLAIGSVVQTLTELEGIDAVWFLIEGAVVEALQKGHMTLNEAIPRNRMLGSIEIESTETRNWQELADKGKEKWRLDPVKAAQEQGPLFGLYASGKYELLEKKEQGEGSGAGEALIRHTHKDEEYEMKMIQPEKQGAEGIWIINSIERGSEAEG